jgi:hypothetical protein
MSANLFDSFKRAPAARESRAQNQYAPEEKGSITGTLGTGENAKNSLVYISILWSFLTAAGFSMVVAFSDMVFHAGDKTVVITDDLAKVWGIFIPIVTLALGYAFGKSQK